MDILADPTQYSPNSNPDHDPAQVCGGYRGRNRRLWCRIWAKRVNYGCFFLSPRRPELLKASRNPARNTCFVQYQPIFSNLGQVVDITIYTVISHQHRGSTQVSRREKVRATFLLVNCFRTEIFDWSTKNGCRLPSATVLTSFFT